MIAGAYVMDERARRRTSGLGKPETIHLMHLLFQAAAALALCTSAPKATVAVLADDGIEPISVGSEHLAASLAGDAKPVDNKLEALATTTALVFAALAGFAFAARGRTEGP